VLGEYAFDQFFASQVANMPDGNQALSLATQAVTQLLEMNNLEIAKFYGRWLFERLSGSESRD
jgi:hypothetical protein